MELSTKKLLENLLRITKTNLNTLKSFKKQSIETLNWKTNSQTWSILECVEHLNRYGDFYIPEIKSRLKDAKHKNKEIFKSNWLGNYFSKSVSYKKELNKMKTFTSMNPLNSKLDITTLDKLINQQHQIIEVLNLVETKNLDKIKTSISISKLLKLKLGDTLRVLIFHNERHIKQAEEIFKKSQQQQL